jgi:uncharacterized membrane-anchored protein
VYADESQRIASNEPQFHVMRREMQKATQKLQEGSSDEKMHAFLDEMRQQFLQTQNVNVIPQSLMYRQT